MLQPGFYNMDCMEGMKEFPDKFFDLAVVDPPYGDASASTSGGLRGGVADYSARKRSRFGGWWASYDITDGRDVGTEVPARGYL